MPAVGLVSRSSAVHDHDHDHDDHSDHDDGEAHGSDSVSSTPGRILWRRIYRLIRAFSWIYSHRVPWQPLRAAWRRPLRDRRCCPAPAQHPAISTVNSTWRLLPRATVAVGFADPQIRSIRRTVPFQNCASLSFTSLSLYDTNSPFDVSGFYVLYSIRPRKCAAQRN